MPEEISKIRERKGESGAGKYVGTAAGKAYAGPDKTFPIGNIAHARNALARAHFAKSPQEIKEKVYSKYPTLKEHHKEREKHKDNTISNFGQPHKEMGHMGKDSKSDYSVAHKQKIDNRHEDKRYKAYK